MNFETALREQIEQTPMRKFRNRRLLAVLDMPDGEKRRHILGLLEKHAAVHLGLPTDGVQAIDWSKVDWARVFDTIMKFLAALLPLLLAL